MQGGISSKTHRCLTATPGPSSLALAEGPQQLSSWFGESRLFSYTAEVQPVWDRHCVSWHDYGKEAAELNLSGDHGPAFNVSYSMLRSRLPSV